MKYTLIGDLVYAEYEEITNNQAAKIQGYFDKKNHTKLTTDKSSILADGIDTATITATVYNYLDEQQTGWTGDIVFDLDGATQTVSTTNGVASITFNTSVAGEYMIKTVVDGFRNGEVKAVAE
jgi:hypothetical protein